MTGPATVWLLVLMLANPVGRPVQSPVLYASRDACRAAGEIAKAEPGQPVLWFSCIPLSRKGAAQ